ncbi:Opr family porin [Arcobacter sp. FWKO B]|uniref:Opr family porin n=1 Tax=Arcobacter sp. FWKO B TaxID=2593672 RepID=UPI0018A34450|nr:Opr family porin [Arcobacter sp. FWKO B]QOG12252.1 hypothetical protein FWKOB_05845 [Arcobacter sp. FWKO B]
MKKLAKLATISLFAATSIYAASDLEEAFKNGTTTGALSVYTKAQNNSGTTKNSGFTVGSAYLNYQTAELNGFSATLGGRANHLFNEKENEDYWDNEKRVRAVVTEANIAYANDLGSLRVGRQEIDLEWIEDYHDAVVGILGYENLTVVAGVTNRFMAADPDGPLAEMGDIKNRDDKKISAQVLDATYTVNDELSVGAYFMNANKSFNATGGFVSAGVAGLETTLKYAQTSEKDYGVQNGKISAIDLSYGIEDMVTLGGGYIKAGKKNGAGSLNTLGDKINPFEEGDKTYNTDAKTWYLSANTEVAGFGLGALYGHTKYDNSGVKEKEKELNLFVDKEIYKNLTASVIYADVKTHNRDDKYNYASLQLTYSF